MDNKLSLMEMYHAKNRMNLYPIKISMENWKLASMDVNAIIEFRSNPEGESLNLHCHPQARCL